MKIRDLLKGTVAVFFSERDIQAIQDHEDGDSVEELLNENSKIAERKNLGKSIRVATIGIM